jgi:hypothetical protein
MPAKMASAGDVEVMAYSVCPSMVTPNVAPESPVDTKTQLYIDAVDGSGEKVTVRVPLAERVPLGKLG